MIDSVLFFLVYGLMLYIKALDKQKTTNLINISCSFRCAGILLAIASCLSSLGGPLVKLDFFRELLPLSICCYINQNSFSKRQLFVLFIEPSDMSSYMVRVDNKKKIHILNVIV